MIHSGKHLALRIDAVRAVNIVIAAPCENIYINQSGTESRGVITPQSVLGCALSGNSYTFRAIGPKAALPVS